MSTLASTRTRRENAGNRMQALLAGQYALQEEEVFEEVVGDEEFEAVVDEVDVFASDFASTDDEADVQGPEAAADAQDRTLQREEAAAEREARTRRFHNPLANAKRKPTTTRPNAVAGPSKSVPTPDRSKKRRVTYEQPEDAFPEDWDIPPERVRAVRTSTIVQKEQVDTRLKKAMATKRAPPTAKKHVELSQSDLIDLALQLETTNRQELEHWLEKEEERRRSVLVKRSVVKGERITWISRTVTADRPVTPVTATPAAETGSRTASPVVATAAVPPSQPEKIRYERNLLNLFQVDRGKEFDVIFGDHADWKAVPVIANKRAQRKCILHGFFRSSLTAFTTSVNRQSTICPITGLSARYKCPRTGIPYANLAAYRIIQHLVESGKNGVFGYRWSKERGAWLSGDARADVLGGSRRVAYKGTDGLDDEEGRAMDVPGWREVMGISAN